MSKVGRSSYGDVDPDREDVKGYSRGKRSAGVLEDVMSSGKAPRAVKEYKVPPKPIFTPGDMKIQPGDIEKWTKKG